MKQMQAVLDVPMTSASTISEIEAYQAASQYVATQIDPAFAVVGDHLANRQSLHHDTWRFFIRCEYGPLSVLKVDVQTGKVAALTEQEIRVIREKAAMYAARQQGILPVNQQGYVLAEYARRRADRYLGDNIGMFFGATEPVFVPSTPARWQMTIVFKMYDIGPVTLGTLDVDAKTGEPTQLTAKQIQHLRGRAHAIVEFQTQTATAPL
jgi:hypothetical protein